MQVCGDVCAIIARSYQYALEDSSGQTLEIAASPLLSNTAASASGVAYPDLLYQGSRLTAGQPRDTRRVLVHAHSFSTSFWLTPSSHHLLASQSADRRTGHVNTVP